MVRKPIKHRVFTTNIFMVISRLHLKMQMEGRLWLSPTTQEPPTGAPKDRHFPLFALIPCISLSHNKIVHFYVCIFMQSKDWTQGFGYARLPLISIPIPNYIFTDSRLPESYCTTCIPKTHANTHAELLSSQFSWLGLSCAWVNRDTLPVTACVYWLLRRFLFFLGQLSHVMQYQPK